MESEEKCLYLSNNSSYLGGKRSSLDGEVRRQRSLSAPSLRHPLIMGGHWSALRGRHWGRVMRLNEGQVVPRRHTAVLAITRHPAPWGKADLSSRLRPVPVFTGPARVLLLECCFLNSEHFKGKPKTNETQLSSAAIKPSKGGETDQEISAKLQTAGCDPERSGL